MKKYNRAKKCLLLSILILPLTVIYSYKNNPTGTNIQADFKNDTIKKTDPLKPDYVAAPLKEWEPKFSSFQFRILTADGHILPYRFYSPPSLQPGKKYPLVFFLHGAGERGNDNRLQLFRFNPVAFWEKYPCFIIGRNAPITARSAG